jgi:hypothetical protein
MKVAAVPAVLRCDRSVARRARYVIDTLLLAAGVPACYAEEPPAEGPWILYAPVTDATTASQRCLHLWHDPAAWDRLDGNTPIERAHADEEMPPRVFAGLNKGAAHGASVAFDLPANAFYFLSSWAERRGGAARRQLYATSEFSRLGIAQDVVDRYMAYLVDRLAQLTQRLGGQPTRAPEWPGGYTFAVVLSHDVDFLPVQATDNLVQGAKSVLRHLLRQGDPGDAWRAARGLVRALTQGRDPYGCIPQVLAREREMNVRSSFQIAVGHRDARDVNYRLEDDRVRDYLRAIVDAGFEVNLHGSCLSTDNPQWYVEEAHLLAQRLARPLGSRQHFLSFDYDALFTAQETAGIRYDMSMGFPDRPGPRAGFSFPYFPYNLREDRPYRVLQISLFLMDVTLRGYLGLRADRAQPTINACLDALQAKRGCASIVWHPIVFGGARDPGYDDLYFRLVERVRDGGGLATDGRTIDAFWREQAHHYPSFESLAL